VPIPVVRAADAGAPVPLIDLRGTYQGQDGGLYGGGSNTPPPSQAAEAANAAAAVRPHDAAGRPRASGRVVLLSIGQSTTSEVYQAFQAMVRSDPSRSPSVVTVDGAQDGKVLQDWAGSNQPWSVAVKRLRGARVSPRQVEVLFIELAQIHADQYGNFDQRTADYRELMDRVVTHAKSLFPNAEIAFISSQTYGGYGPQGADPEPYAYESAFGVRSTIQSQIDGDPSLNPDPAHGRPRAPVLLWGPYDWSHGDTPNSTGLQWSRGDFLADGGHPSGSGRAKVGALLTEFFTNDPYARPWFTAH